MKKKNITYLIIYIIIVVIVVAVGFVIDKKNKKEAAEADTRQANIKYTRYLYIEGDFSYEGNKVKAENMVFDDNHLMVDVGYYNYRRHEQLTIEQLYEEYKAFRNGESDEKHKKLDEYIKYIDDFCDVGNDYAVYCAFINNELRNIREEKQAKGEDVSTLVEFYFATPQELMEAIDRVNQKENLDLD